MRLLIVGLSLTLAATAFAFDAKSDCLKALAEAKKAGLPISPADLHIPKPTQEGQKIESLIAKAEKINRRNMPTFEQTIAQDLTNLDRRNKGKPELPRKSETPEQTASRIRDVLVVIDQLGQTKGLPMHNDPSQSVVGEFSTMSRTGLLTAFLRIKLDDATNSAKSGNGIEVAKKLRIARRMLELDRTDATFISLMRQMAAERIYYKTVLKLAKHYPSVKKSIGADLFAPISRPSIQTILQEEFLKGLSVYFQSQKVAKTIKDKMFTGDLHKSKINPGWQLPKDKGVLALIAREAKSNAFAYSKLKVAKNFAELERIYAQIVPKLDRNNYEKESWPMGPTFAEKATVLNKGEEARLSALRELGLAKV